jgi:hypothetical protein
MALPQNTQQPSVGASEMERTYMRASIKEAISTGFKAAGMQAGSNILMKSPILRGLGGGAVADYLDVRKREMYERQGRDEQGRKLTKQEFEDREKRRKDLGALSEIRDTLQFLLDTGKGDGIAVTFAPDSIPFLILSDIQINLSKIADAMSNAQGSLMGFSTFGNNAGQRQILGPDGNPYDDSLENIADRDDATQLDTQEMMEETEREDDRDQIESEERQQGFLTKLLGNLKLMDKFKLVADSIGNLTKTIKSLFVQYLSASILSKLLGLGGGGAGGLLRTIGGAAVTGIGAAGRAIGAGAAAAGGAFMKTGAGQTIATAGKEVAKGGRFVGSMVGTAGEVIKNVGGSVVGKAKGLVGAGAGKPSIFGKAFGALGDVAAKLNPMKYLKDSVKKLGPKILKGLTSIPGLSALITSAMAAFDLNSIKNNQEMSPDEKKEEIGKLVGRSLGSILGSVGGGVLGSFLPIPGIGTILGAMGGEWVGSTIGEALAEAMGPKAIYDFAKEIPGIGSFFDVEPENPQQLESQTAPTTTPEGGSMPEAPAAAAMPMSAAAITPPVPAGVEIPSMSSQTEALKSMPSVATSVNSATTNVQTNSNMMIASGLSARQSTGIDMTGYFSGFRPQLA